MIKVDLKPSPQKLRQFGWIGLFGFGVIGLIAKLIWGLEVLPIVLWSLGGICALLAAVQPKWLLPIYLGLTIISFPIGFIIGNIAVGLIFFCMFVPLALFFRLIGRDSMQRKFEPEAQSYFDEVSATSDVKDYYRQS